MLKEIMAQTTYNEDVTTIVDQAERYVSKMLTEQLSEHFHFHNLPHTLAVRDAALRLCDHLDVAGEDREILALAALFHDTGYARVYQGHEEASIRIAREFLQTQGYPQEKTDQVLACIAATVPDKQPVNLAESIIKDADLSNLAREDYMTGLANLRYEWQHFLGHHYNDPEWYELNHQFLKNYQFFTLAARELFGEQHRANQKHLKELARQSKGDTEGISGNKGAQMMFKTALRNHIDLSNLADNKANIMLSVNALIITIAMPLAATYVKTSSFLLIPMISLLATCLTSMVFATLATRPIKMTGQTAPELIKSGKANLFFFGNFYGMSFEEYKKGMNQVLSRAEILDEAIMRDLYYLGRSLGKKYRRLRICYNIFMGGVVTTVVVFGICYAIYLA